MLALLLLPALAYCRTPYRRLRRRGNSNVAELVLAGALVPVIRLTGDLAKMIGYPVGRAIRASRPGPT